MVDKDLVDCKTWGLFSTAFHGWAKSKLHNDDMGNSKQFLTPAHFASCLSTAASNQQNRFLVYLLFKLYANICSSFLTTTAPYTHSRLLAKTHHHIRSSCVLLSISPMMHIHVLCTCWWCRLLFKYTSIVERSSWRCGQLFWAVSSLSLLFPQKTHRISTPFRVAITLNL